jgi:hypothetical protein
VVVVVVVVVVEEEELVVVVVFVYSVVHNLHISRRVNNVALRKADIVCNGEFPYNINAVVV